jgi:hypothetical protein
LRLSELQIKKSELTNELLGNRVIGDRKIICDLGFGIASAGRSSGVHAALEG